MMVPPPTNGKSGMYLNQVPLSPDGTPGALPNMNAVYDNGVNLGI